MRRFDHRTPHQRSDGLQRFFTSFPTGPPGAALLLLRTVAGGAAAIQGGAYLAHGAEANVAAWTLGVLAILGGIGLVAGFLTPAAAVAVSVTIFLMAVSWTRVPPGILVIDRVATGLLIADAAALALLGPGAHSIDAYLFGRREIIFPDDRPRR